VFDLLRSVWREPRPEQAPPRAWWDWALVVALVITAVVEGVVRPDLFARPASVLVSVTLVLTLLWRKSRTLPAIVFAFGLCVAAAIVAGRNFPDQYVLVCLLLLPFSVFRWGSGRELLIGASVILCKLFVSAALGYLSLGDTVAGVIVLSTAMALGAALRYRSRARTRELDQVKLLERERLARDLHDTVAHHVSAMAIRAQAGIATAAADPTAAVDALHVIDAEAARALDEMRGMVRILRAEADLSPGPRVADLSRLASVTRPEVSVAVLGDVDALPAPVGAAVYRLAQEAVTNARRHARHATRIEVRVEVNETAVHVKVSDDGELAMLRSGTPGYGLTGMIERANLLGGTCEAGPNTDRGWTVTAVLPRTGA
jgi:signal transduction histidine kinase